MGTSSYRNELKNSEYVADAGVVRCDGVSLDKEGYDLRSRMYTCYLLCTSMVCVVPLVPYYLARELHKRGRKLAAAISLEVFQYIYGMLTMGLLFIKVFIFILGKNPRFLDNFFIKNKDLAVFFLAAMCVIPLTCFVAVFRYYLVHDNVVKQKCGTLDAIIARSFLDNTACGLPALVGYSEETGPLGISNLSEGNYGADVIYEIYLYCTSYVLLIPACCTTLCQYFQRRGKYGALFITRVLAASAHVLLVNAVLMGAVFYCIFSSYSRFLCMTTCSNDEYIGIALMSGVLLSSFVFFTAMAFFYNRVASASRHLETSSSSEMTNGIARDILKFGLLTVAVSTVCSLFRTKAKLREQFIKYPKGEFAYDLVRRVVSAVFILPACFLLLSELYREKKNKKLAAVTSRASLFLEIFMGNALCFYGIATAVFYIPQVRKILLIKPKSMGFVVSAAMSLIVMVAAIVVDTVLALREASKVRKSHESVILEDKDLDYRISQFGVINLIAAAVIAIAYPKVDTAQQMGLQVTSFKSMSNGQLHSL